jgi:zinc finger protein-like protein
VGGASDGTPRGRDFLQRRAHCVSRLRQKCASVRAALETHVRAEETDIWPLFAENFSVAEQSALVGAVIGRTGAVVLEALIPWVMGSVSEAEQSAMMESLRKVCTAR